jgi:hypothetical protein
MIQPLSGDVSRSLVLVGRNSVLRPDRELRTALEGPIGPDASTPVGCVTEVKLCRTLRELSQTLQGQADVAAGLGPLPVPLLRYRQEFLESLHTTVFSVSLVVQARRVLEGIEAQEPHLRGDVAPPTDPSGLDRFVAQHGDCRVRSVQLGGEVQGIFTLYAQSREEAEAMVRSIGLTLPLEGLTLSPELGSQLSRIRRETSVNSSLRVRVLGLSQAPAVGSADELVALTSSFGGLTIDAPVVLSAETRGYEEIPELMTVFQPVVANRQLFCGTGSKPGLLRRKERLLEIANQCRWVEETCRLYGQPPEPTLQNQGRQVRADIAAIDELAEAFARSAASTLQVPELPALLQGSPRLVPMIRDGHRLGGEGGEPFAFSDRSRAIQRRRRLWKVGLNAGRLIDRIRLTYRQESDPVGSDGLANEWTEAYGGGGGDDRGMLELDLDNHEQITTLNANTGTGVDQLEVISSDGQRLAGGRPSNGGRASSWRAGRQEVLLGFQGRAKTWLDALQPVIADFQDALRWEPVREEEDP